MTEFFLSLEQDFIKYLNTINRKLVDVNSKPDTAESAISDIQSELKEAEKCIKQMEIEVMHLADIPRKENSQRIRRHKADYEDVRKTFLRAEEAFREQRDRNGLFSGASNFEIEESKTSHRGGTLLDAQNRKLENAKKTGYATIDMANNTNQELYRQTEVLQRNKSRLQQMDSDLRESNSLIGSMQKKIMKNKVTLYSVVGIVILAFLLIILSYF